MSTPWITPYERRPGAPPSSTSIALRCRRLAWWSSAAGGAIGAVVFFAWLVRPWLPGAPSWLWLMKANTALCLAACGGALTARLAGARGRWLGVVLALAAAASAIGAVTLLEYLSGIDLRIDRLLAGDPGATLPGRMAPMTASCFTLLGIGILLFTHDRGPGSWACDTVIVLAGMLLELVLSGYLFRQIVLVGLSELTRTAPHTLLALSLVWLALVLARADAGLFRVIGGSGTGSAATRILLPATLIIPIALGMLRTWGEARDLYPSSLGVAVFAAIQSILFAALVIVFGIAQNRSDEELRLARRRHEELERMVAICAWTRRVRWKGQWVSIEDFLMERFGLTITHGISEEALADLLAAHSAPGSPESPPGSTYMPDE
ncbi:MAG: hypothetical protein IT436_12435 [Phycisphaerales bacterium]|nr:hypothetical protein [Phycisphaerales bacterium]